MNLYHTTHQSLEAVIRRDGLDPRLARGKRIAVWLHTKTRHAWAIRHLAKHHHVPESSLITFTVSVPRGWITRRRRGIWTCDHHIPQERITS